MKYYVWYYITHARLCSVFQFTKTVLTNEKTEADMHLHVSLFHTSEGYTPKID